MCVSNAVTFESFDLESSFLVCRISGSSPHKSVRSSGQGHRSRKACLCILFVGGLLATERQLGSGVSIL